MSFFVPLGVQIKCVYSLTFPRKYPKTIQDSDICLYIYLSQSLSLSYILQDVTNIDGFVWLVYFTCLGGYLSPTNSDHFIMHVTKQDLLQTIDIYCKTKKINPRRSQHNFKHHILMPKHIFSSLFNKYTCFIIYIGRFYKENFQTKYFFGFHQVQS